MCGPKRQATQWARHKKWDSNSDVYVTVIYLGHPQVMSATFSHYNNIFTRWHRWAINYTLVCTPPEWVHSVHQCSFVHRKQLFDCIALLSFAVCPVLASGDSRMTASVCLAISHAHFVGHATHLDAHFISNCAKNLKCPFLVDFRCHTLGMAWHKGPGGWKPSFCAKYSWLIAAHLFDNMPVDKIAKCTWLYSCVAWKVLALNWSPVKSLAHCTRFKILTVRSQRCESQGWHLGSRGCGDCEVPQWQHFARCRHALPTILNLQQHQPFDNVF